MFRVPPEFQDRDVEMIILPLDEPNGNGERNKANTDENGYPIGFFEETAGSLADDPIVRAPQGDFDIREEIL